MGIFGGDIDYFCVIGKLDDGVGTVGCDVVVGVQSVQQWGENNALGTSCAECERG